MFSRGQTSVEYLVLSSFLLLVAGILFIYSFNSVTDATVFVNARSSVELLGNAADNVSALGNNSQKIVDIELPEGVNDFNVIGKEIILNVLSGENTRTFWYETKTDLTPAGFSTEKGFHRFKLIFSDGNILVSEVS
ncbi:MAG: hypothetical protein JW703_04090 [Candidatus Diapherotrites archaeon]|nr:hypothetical protein [Candidatus Diapherotrites archaeon]